MSESRKKVTGPSPGMLFCDTVEEVQRIGADLLSPWALLKPVFSCSQSELSAVT